jgi:predicted flap endonuclease-1-like 5' DNA nuclease/GTP cyclohydrolase II
MIALMSQMLGCLLIAAGIGVAVGWLLRGLPKNSPDHSYGDLANLLRSKEQALETISHDLKVKTSGMQILEQKIMSSETLYSSAQREVTARGERVKALEAELAVRSKRLTDLDAEAVAARRREGEFTAHAAAQALELQAAQQACQAAEHAREVMEQEVRVQREHIAQLNEGLADRDELRARLKQFESVQSRVHQLEVELSDREAAHRGVIQQLEQAIAERDRRIEELVPVTHLLREKQSELKEWERIHARTMQELEGETAKFQEQCAAQDQLRSQHLLNEQRLHERDEQIASLHRELHALQAERRTLLEEVQGIPQKDEHIDRLQQRLKELRVTLRTKPDSAAVGLPLTPPNRTKLRSQEGPPKVGVGKDSQKDDLKKIHGIGPVFAQTLNKMGTYTFIQIARWKPDDIEKIAKKLETDPDRIKRDKWIADAKEQHFRKYGERL